MKQIRHIESNIPLELQLVVLCCISRLTDEQERRLQELAAGDLDWDHFILLVQKNRVYPLVYNKLSQIQTCVDRTVVNILEKKYKKNVIYSMGQLAELVKVMSWLNTAGIRTISLKGPVLSKEIYQDISLRTSSDLDILADKEDVERIEQILLKNGYYVNDRSSEMSKKQRDTVLRISHHFKYYNENNNFIELHWKYSNESGKPYFNNIWNRKKTVRISGVDVHLLSDEDNLAYLILHGSKHGWKRLRWMCDVYEIMKKNEIDWKLLIRRANELNAFFMLEQSVILLKEVFDLEYPKEFENHSFSRKSMVLANMSLPLISTAEDKAGTWGHPLCLHMKRYMLLTLTIKEQITFLTGHLYPTPDDFMLLRLKDKYFFLYYILHPFFMLIRLFRRKNK